MRWAAADLTAFTAMHCARNQLNLVFFFQAEDGIRDIGVTGVQTCALPISQIGARACGKARCRSALEHQIFDPEFLAIFALAALVAVLAYRVDVRTKAMDFWFGIQPAVATGDQGLRDVANRGRHIATLLLWQQRVFLSFEQTKVRIMTDNDIDVAKGADFLKEAHVPGVKPVIASGHDHLLPVRQRGLGRQLRKPPRLLPAQKVIAHPMLVAIRTTGVVGWPFLVHPDLRAKTSHQGQDVIAHGAHRKTAAHVAHGLDKILSLRQREPGRFTSEGPNRRVVPEQYVHLTQFGRFLKESEMMRTNVIESTGYDDLFCSHTHQDSTRIIT